MTNHVPSWTLILSVAAPYFKPDYREEEMKIKSRYEWRVRVYGGRLTVLSNQGI
ncbi:hypothetical protein PGT21_018765 [Puccinia graminis f. sp. tritici]|uniref:Uncharacterized protein n=1 Tax=Puccinia graminis f. sp. tritici TaxID=56615 RepID=A0A5B0RHU7_PUCGR|nr:hypothetical protein PGT21_018765 [Puccinia graminis f. sp. tritici]KAA1125521.1 hypothetical protein PGTUg99_013427 [Puccinia graminis f. sp. tritici]